MKLCVNHSCGVFMNVFTAEYIVSINNGISGGQDGYFEFRFKIKGLPLSVSHLAIIYPSYLILSMKILGVEYGLYDAPPNSFSDFFSPDSYI